MIAFNAIRYRVKRGNEQAFIDDLRKLRPAFRGFLGGHLVRTGERTFCLIGQWRSLKALAAARPAMIATLDGFRALLEDLGGGLGVTDPVSGESVAKLRATPAAKRRAQQPAAAKRTGNTVQFSHSKGAGSRRPPG